MKTSNSIANAETTNLPVTKNAIATKAALRIVRLILLMILVDRPTLLDQRHDVRQPRFGQNDASCALGNVGRGAHRNAHFGLAQCGRIVDAVACHAGHVSRGLQMLHNNVFVFRKNLSKTIGASQQVDRLVAGLS
jgi:hypothetical protein